MVVGTGCCPTHSNIVVVLLASRSAKTRPCECAKDNTLINEKQKENDCESEAAGKPVFPLTRRFSPRRAPLNGERIDATWVPDPNGCPHPKACGSKIAPAAHHTILWASLGRDVVLQESLWVSL